MCEAENISTEGPQGPDEPDGSHGKVEGSDESAKWVP